MRTHGLRQRAQSTPTTSTTSISILSLPIARETTRQSPPPQTEATQSTSLFVGTQSKGTALAWLTHCDGIGLLRVAAGCSAAYKQFKQNGCFCVPSTKSAQPSFFPTLSLSARNKAPKTNLFSKGWGSHENTPVSLL